MKYKNMLVQNQYKFTALKFLQDPWELSLWLSDSIPYLKMFTWMYPGSTQKPKRDVSDLHWPPQMQSDRHPGTKLP